MSVSSPAPAVTIQQYLRSSYEPDREFVDGYLEERNLGEHDHARIQTLVAHWLMSHEREWGVHVVVEQRVQVSPTRFRVPDVCVTRGGEPIQQIVQSPPLICVEVLSPDDSMKRVRERIADYQRMGVEHIWLLDPSAREGFVCTSSGMNQPPNGRLSVPGTEIFVSLADIFARLD